MKAESFVEDIKLLNFEMMDQYFMFNDYLMHMNKYINTAQNKIGESLEMYSDDFFEFYYANSYGQIHRNSFLVSLISVSESCLKKFINNWFDFLNKPDDFKRPNYGILDFLKEADKSVLEINIDFNSKSVLDFKGLVAIRNSIVHSNSNLEFVQKYKSQIIYMVKSYPNVKLSNDNYIYTLENFGNDCLEIIRRFFYYLFKLSIRKAGNTQFHMKKHENGNFK